MYGEGSIKEEFNEREYRYGHMNMFLYSECFALAINIRRLIGKYPKLSDELSQIANQLSELAYESVELPTEPQPILDRKEDDL